MTASVGPRRSPRARGSLSCPRSTTRTSWRGRRPWGARSRGSWGAAGRVAGVVLVEDDALREAVHFLWQQCRLAVEPSGAATTAAVRSGAIHPVSPTVLVVSGGNVDPSSLED